MKKYTFFPFFLSAFVFLLATCSIAPFSVSLSAANPYLPLWEYIPDGEPYVFEDPDKPGEKRVYVYGSHDSMRDAYCGRELVLWSASPNNLNDWRYEGIIFESKKDAQGQLLHKDGRGDVLYAPDVCEVIDSVGNKTYYLYPNNQEGGRKNMVAKAARPDGPFEVCNWSEDNPRRTEGCLDFDPAVFMDDDGRVYAYWGIDCSWAAELDPENMARPKPGTEIVKNLISSRLQDGIFRFFEASSMRKIGDKYVLIYSRWTADGEFNLGQSNYTLAYAYADKPLGPFKYGGTIIDGRGRDIDSEGKACFTATPNGNTHGSIVEIDGQWWVFYHRQCGTDEYSRQAMVAPIHVTLLGNKVLITEGEYTSEGFETQGLNPYEKHSAGIACHYTGARKAVHRWPHKEFFGSYPAPQRLDDIAAGNSKLGKTAGDKLGKTAGANLSLEALQKLAAEQPYDLRINHNAVINNSDGSVVGYKYFNFDHSHGDKKLSFYLELVPKGINGHIDIYAGHPDKNGIKLGKIKVSDKLPQELCKLSVKMPRAALLQHKAALYLVIHVDAAPDAAPNNTSAPSQPSLCDLHYFGFESR